MYAYYIISMTITCFHDDHVFLTFGAHAQRGLVCPCVCLSVCLSTTILALQATRRPKSDTKRFSATRVWKLKWRFSWNDCVRERQTGTVADRVPWPNPSLSGAHAYRRGMLAPPRPDPLALCTLEAQEATAKGVYRLPHAIYYCS